MTKTGRNKGPVFMMRHYGANLPRSELGMHTRTMRARLPNGELEYAGHMDQFVLASDYDALQSQLAHLTQQRDGLLLAMRAMHIEYMDYLSMLIDEYPAAQSRGGTFLTVLLREKQNLLLDSTRRAALTPAQEAQT